MAEDTLDQNRIKKSYEFKIVPKFSLDEIVINFFTWMKWDFKR